MNATPPSPHEIWREFHWAFFLNVQGLVVALRRFQMQLERKRLACAEKELAAASTLLMSSAAAMELAASFTKDEYEHTIRVSMTPPTVESDDFSGLMSWEHAELVSLWRAQRPIFKSLPQELAAARARFLKAYRHLAESHTAVCARFVDSDAGSLRVADRSALETLRRFGRGRMALLDPAGKGCPMYP